MARALSFGSSRSRIASRFMYIVLGATAILLLASCFADKFEWAAGYRDVALEMMRSIRHWAPSGILAATSSTAAAAAVSGGTSALSQSITACSIPWRREEAAPQSPGVPGANPSILVLDLDETLVHSVMGSNTSPIPVHVFLRPGVSAFLEAMHAAFDELVLFTAGTQEYADYVVDTFLDPGRRLIKRRFYRQSCTPMVLATADATYGDTGSVYLVKDLRIVQPASPPSLSLSNVVILDNTPSAYALQPDNAVAIESYLPMDDPVSASKDRELARVRPILECIAQQMRSNAQL